MRDTSAQAAVAAFATIKRADASCAGTDMKMNGTRMAEQSADLGPDLFGSRYTGTWAEVWQFETCGRRVDVPVQFRPDGDGGAYTNVLGTQAVLLDSAQP